MRRRHLLSRQHRRYACALAHHPPCGQPVAVKTLRVCFPSPKPALTLRRSQDDYSNSIINHIFDAPLRYDFIARPVQLRAEYGRGDARSFVGLPHVHVRLQPGIFFQDDPAFDGKRRELVAADYVYSIKRVFDPRWKSQIAVHSGSTRDIAGLISAAAARAEK